MAAVRGMIYLNCKPHLVVISDSALHQTSSLILFDCRLANFRSNNCQEEQDQDSKVSVDITISVIVSVTYF